MINWIRRKILDYKVHKQLRKQARLMWEDYFYKPLRGPKDGLREMIK